MWLKALSRLHARLHIARRSITESLRLADDVAAEYVLRDENGLHLKIWRGPTHQWSIMLSNNTQVWVFRCLCCMLQTVVQSCPIILPNNIPGPTLLLLVLYVIACAASRYPLVSWNSPFEQCFGPAACCMLLLLKPQFGVYLQASAVLHRLA